MVIQVPTPVFANEEYEQDCVRERQTTFETIIKEQQSVIDCEAAKNAAQREFRRTYEQDR